MICPPPLPRTAWQSSERITDPSNFNQFEIPFRHNHLLASLDFDFALLDCCLISSYMSISAVVATRLRDTSGDGEC